MRLTKNRLEALDSALSLDDILYEKFRRLNEHLRQREMALARKKHVVRVIQKRGKLHYNLQILDVTVTPKGTIVLCS